MKTEMDVAAKIFPPPAERRLIYNGDGSESSHRTQVQPAVSRTNRAVKHPRRSPSLILAGIVLASLFIVFYVWNKISVNKLVVELGDQQVQYQKILNANELLRAEINKKSGLDRIGKIASERIGLVFPKEQPIWFDLDEEPLRHLHHRVLSEKP